MQKKIIVLAIAAALSAPALALADTANVTVYGVVNLSADYISTGKPTSATAADGVSKLIVSSNQSRLGLKGSEDLGGGLSAVWQIESLIAMDNAGGSLGLNRNTFAGLKSDSMGTVLLGRHDTPYQMTTRKLDVFMDGLADSRGLMGGGAAATANTSSKVPFDGRQPDSIVYISPAFSGFTGAVARVNTAETRNDVSDASSNIISLAGMYTAGPIYGSLALEVHSFKAVAAGVETKTSETATKLGFGFTQDALTVNVVVEQSKDDFGAAKVNSLGHTSIYVAGKYNLASGAVKAAVAQAGKTAAANTEAQQVSLGYDHNLSKRTIAYVAYTMITNGSAATYGLAGNSTGGGSASTISGAGADPSALSFGVRHMF